ncbi:MAG: hypothetical protein JXR46_07825 [Calditrichaceae bacterium]|nr:hypothetical protein [Calditrichaceae bacterium]MBN2708936.1 hypothetical protein [Calditrichaceae bacterium]RQV97541.1 MAG: hypothetical protein EH224_00535 [Calditrichota bacterium]
MNFKLRKMNVTLFLSMLFMMLVLISCDSILPDDYKEETFFISALDDKACQLLSDAYVFDVSGAIIDSNFVRVSAKKVTEIYDTTGIGEKVTEISKYIDDLDFLSTNALYNSRCQGESQPVDFYLAINKSAGMSGSLTFFLSYELTKKNKNISFDMALYNAAGAQVGLNNSMPAETYAYCKQVIDTLTNESTFKIRGRYSASLSDGKYLVKVTISESAKLISDAIKKPEFQIVVL